MTLLEGGKAQPSFPTPRLVPVSLHHTLSHNLSVLHRSSEALWVEFCALPLIRPRLGDLTVPFNMQKHPITGMTMVVEM